MQNQNNGRVNVNNVLTFVKKEEKTEFIFMYGYITQLRLICRWQLGEKINIIQSVIFSEQLRDIREKTQYIYCMKIL